MVKKLSIIDIMNEKEYIESLSNLIFNRVKYHSPKFNCEIDLALPDIVGIDAKYPVFIYEKPLDKIFYKAFLKAKKSAEFNLILTEQPRIKRRKLKNLGRTYIFLNDELGPHVHDALYALNINYPSHSDFNFEMQGEFLKINHKMIEYEFKQYFNYSKFMCDGVVCEVKNFVLNGKNYIMNFSNTTRTIRTIEFEFNLPLPRGYYIFKKANNYIEIENLTNKDKAYFNYNIKNADVKFSTINGIESCTFACVNLKCKISLLAKETRKFYFNFGNNKYCLNTPKEVNLFFDISQEKMNEIFNIKITTRDKNFDDEFNRVLPQKIWNKWQQFDIDEESENEWLKIKSSIIKTNEQGMQIQKNFKGLKEVKIYKDNKWKRIFIVHNDVNYLFADNVKYFNFTILTKEIFAKNDEIYLSFAD